MTKILKNNTSNDVFINDTGQTVPLLNQLVIDPGEYNLYAASDDIIDLVGSNTLTVNDGSKDLTPSQGINLIQGTFPIAAGGVGGYNLYNPNYIEINSSATEIELPRDTENYTTLYSYFGTGSLSGFSMMFNSDNVLVILETDDSQVFEIDCNILENMAPKGDTSVVDHQFSWINWDKDKNVLRFYPKYDIAFFSNIKIQAKANTNSNKRSMLSYLINIIKES